MTTETATSTVPLWIGGQETASTRSRHGQVTNSATGQAARIVPFPTSEDIDLAVDAARTAWPAWRDTTPPRRARVLMKALEIVEHHKEELARLITIEHGKTIPDAIGEETKVITKRCPSAPEAVSLTMPTMD